MSENDIKLAAKHWDKTLPDLNRTFYGFPLLRPYLYRQVSGRSPEKELKREWAEEFCIDEFLSDRIPVERCLSLCCGFGEGDRILARRGIFKSCLGLDLAEKALDSARQAAKKERLDMIEYQQANLNELTLEENQYDLVWANGALHHLSNLEHIFEQIHKTLKPGGILISNEYVGAKHQAYGFRQREAINAALHIMPERFRAIKDGHQFIPIWFRKSDLRKNLYKKYRKLLRKVGFYKGRFVFEKLWDYDPTYFIEEDPSEGVRADEIIPIAKQIFDQVDVRHYNGSILYRVLGKRFFDNFDPEREEDITFLDMMCKLEESMVKMGEIPSDNAIICAKKIED